MEREVNEHGETARTCLGMTERERKEGWNGMKEPEEFRWSVH